MRFWEGHELSSLAQCTHVICFGQKDISKHRASQAEKVLLFGTLR